MSTGRLLRTGILITILFVLLILVTALVVSTPWMVRRLRIEERFQQALRNQIGYVASTEKTSITLLPVPRIQFEHFELRALESSTRVPLLRADRVRLRPSLLSLLVGDISLSRMTLENADFHYLWKDEKKGRLRTLSLLESSVDLRNIKSGSEVPFEFRSRWLSDSENVSLTGTIQTEFGEVRPVDVASQMDVSLGPIVISELARWWGPLPLHIDSGTVEFSGTIRKAKGSPDIDVKGTVDVKGFVYDLKDENVRSTAADYQVTLEFQVNIETGMVIKIPVRSNRPVLIDIRRHPASVPFGGKGRGQNDKRVNGY